MNKKKLLVIIEHLEEQNELLSNGYLQAQTKLWECCDTLEYIQQYGLEDDGYGHSIQADVSSLIKSIRAIKL